MTSKMTNEELEGIVDMVLRHAEDVDLVKVLSNADLIREAWSLSSVDGDNVVIVELMRRLDRDYEEYIKPCEVPPDGWFCTRYRGHDGPCAAINTTVAPNDK